MQSPGERLRWARKQANYASAAAAAAAYGWKKSTYAGHENGDRNPSRSAAKRYGQALGVPWVWILEGGPVPDGKEMRAVRAGAQIPIKGEVAAGRWLDVDVDIDARDFERYPVTASPDFPYEAQYGLIVRGTSINRVAAVGDVLHCIDVGISGVVAHEDDLVIVERRRSQQGQREVTAKRLRKNGNIMVLAPDSTDPRWQPIELDTDNPPEDEEVAVIAIVIGRYQPFRKRK